MNAENSEYQSAMRRIKRCLALAASSNPHEAETAARQAKALMQKHGLTESCIAAAEMVEAVAGNTTGSNKLHLWEQALAASIAVAFGCESIFMHGSRTNRGGRKKGKIVYFGPEGRATIASYSYETLVRQLRADIKTFKKDRSFRITTAKDVKLFSEGWVFEACKKVDLLASPFTDGDFVKSCFYEKVKPIGDAQVKKQSSVENLQEYEAMRRGSRSGQAATLNPAMNGKDEAFRLQTAGAA